MSDERAHDDPQKIFKNSTNRQLPIDISSVSPFAICDCVEGVSPLEIRNLVEEDQLAKAKAIIELFDQVNTIIRDLTFLPRADRTPRDVNGKVFSQATPINMYDGPQDV